MSGTRIRYEGESVILGEYRCRPHEPSFHEDSAAYVWPSFSFPRMALGIHHADANPVLGDTNTAFLFTVGRPYRRIPVDSRGSWTEWIEVRPDLVREMVQAYEPRDDYAQSLPFRIGGAPAPNPAYVDHRLTRVLLSRFSRPDALELEERSLNAVAAVLQSAYACLGRRCSATSGRADRTHQQTAFEVKERLNQQLDKHLTLSDLSTALEVSPFHLCRIFRTQTGIPIHQYRNRLRLRASLDSVFETHLKIVNIALDLGYSSEAHFCDAFRRQFGISPGELRSNSWKRGLWRLFR